MGVTMMRRALAVAALSIACTGTTVALAESANAATPHGGALLDRISRCESGNRNVPNSSGASSAQGYFQIVKGTWRAYHGTQFAPTAMGASYAEQRIVAERIMRGQGPGAWRSSARCWAR
jgi:ABC-type phosphate transport system substrate-binding protein